MDDTTRAVAIAVGMHFRDPKLPKTDAALDALAQLFELAALAAVDAYLADSAPNFPSAQEGRR